MFWTKQTGLRQIRLHWDQQQMTEYIVLLLLFSDFWELTVNKLTRALLRLTKVPVCSLHLSHTVNLKPFQPVLLCKMVFFLFLIVVPASGYTDTNNEQEKTCRHAVCRCDIELVRCMQHYKDIYNTDNLGFTSSCAFPSKFYFTLIWFNHLKALLLHKRLSWRWNCNFEIARV